MIQITSLQNNRIKNLVKLSKRRERDQQRVTIVEGTRELTQLVHAGITPKEVYLCPDLLDEQTESLLTQLQQMRQGIQRPTAEREAETTSSETSSPLTLIEVTQPIFEKIAYRASGGLVAVIPYINRSLAELTLPQNPFLIVIEGIEKPGNLGAILRTADAVGVDAVIVCAGATDVHNPNVVRASLGALFTQPILEVNRGELIKWLRDNGIQIIAADPAATVDYTTENLAQPLAIVMGSEADGLSDEWRVVANSLVTIPMHGVVDSLNLSVATAVILYEALRQRM